MSNIIREFKEFNPDEESNQNIPEIPYPYSFEFTSEEDEVYRMEVSDDLQSFRVFIPDGRLIYSTTESLFALKMEEGVFSEFCNGFLWRWMRKILLSCDLERSGSNVSKWAICEKENFVKIDPATVLYNSDCAAKKETFDIKETEDKDYPYSSDFVGQEGKYRLEVAPNYEDFRVVYPDGKAVCGSVDLVPPGAAINSLFGQENGVLLYFIQQQFYEQALPHVMFEQRFNFSKEPVQLTIIPSRQLCFVTIPGGKLLYFRTTASFIISRYINNDNAILEWIASKIYDTNFFYLALLGGRSLYESKLYESNEESQQGRNKGTTAAKIVINDKQSYQIFCDKEKDIIVAYYPARCIPTSSDRFFEDVDGLIGTANGKIESFYLSRLRTAGFDMKTILKSRNKAMDVIDAWRQND